MVIQNCHRPIRCSTLEISGTSISRLEGDKIVLTVPREQIRHIVLIYDSDVKNPFCRYLLGFVLLLLGLIGLTAVLLASAGGRPLIQPETGSSEIAPIIIALWAMMGIGIWLLMGIFRARYQLLIHTPNGPQRAPFSNSMKVPEIRQFIRRAHMFFGYEIDISLLDKIHSSSS